MLYAETMRTQSQPTDGRPPLGGAGEVLAATLAGAQAALACWERRADGDLYLVTANDRYLEFVGRPGADLIGERLEEAVPVIQAEGAALMHHVASSGEALELHRFVRRSARGEVSYWDVAIVPVRGPGPARIVVSAHDTTRLVQAEETLSARNQALQGRTERESARLRALARVAASPSRGGGLDGVLLAIAEGVRAAFGLDTVINVLDEAGGVYLVRAGSGGGVDRMVGTANPRSTLESLLQPEFEVIPDVFFVPHDAHHPSWERMGDTVMVPAFGWRGPGYWHPEDGCFVRLRTSEGRDLGLLSIDSPTDQAIPDRDTFRLLRLFALVGANAAENLLLLREIGSLEAEREMQQLRRELEEEVALHRSLLEIGNRLGLASAAVASREIFPLLFERLSEVVPIQSLTIARVDHATQTVKPIYHSEAGPIAEAMLRFEVPFGVGATGRAVTDLRPVISNSGQPDAVAIKVPGTHPEDEHVMAVPVMVDERVRAVLTLHRPCDRPPFTPDDARRAELFGQHLLSVLLLTELAQTSKELAESRRALADQVEQLESLNRMKDEFVANVSHELRTPLTAVIGNVATVARGGEGLGAEEREELLAAAERQAKRLAEMLENLLATSRLAEEDPAIVPLPVDLGPFVEEVAATLRSRAPRRRVEVELPGAIQITTDPTLLYRVLFNLGDNALKYSDGPVRFSVRLEPEWVRIDVRDWGIGIAPENVARIFERFEQLDSSNTRRVGGVGLGLYLSARGARAMGGRIEVRSGIDEGSTFSLWLPRRSQG